METVNVEEERIGKWKLWHRKKFLVKKCKAFSQYFFLVENVKNNKMLRRYMRRMWKIRKASEWIHMRLLEFPGLQGGDAKLFYS